MTQNNADPIFIEALEWFARTKDEQASAADRLALAEWINQDPSHAEAYERAKALWDRFDIIKPEYDRLQRAKRIRRRNILLGLGIGAPFLYIMSRPETFADYTTDVGQRRLVELADGSSVELGSYSSLSVDYSESERRLTLHRGQGFFTVAADSARPFIVAAGAGASRAMGTQFDVKHIGDSVSVTVVEHSVSVQIRGREPVIVSEGWQVSYDAHRAISPRLIDVENQTAWRRDQIVFEDAPLRDVLAELERYRRGRIILMDNSVGNISVTAIFRTDEAEAALRTIADTLPVRVLNPEGRLAIVYRR